MDFIDKIGGWRMSTYAGTKLPSRLYQVVEKQIVEIPTATLLKPPKKKKLKSISIILMNLLVTWRN